MKQKVKYEWLDEYCLAQAGATRDYKLEWDAERYMVGGKMFALCGGDKDGKPIITLKLDPALGSSLREQYKDIIPGYYMNKEHWNSLYLEGDVPDDVVRTMVVESYQLIFKSLSKKAQKEIMETLEMIESRCGIICRLCEYREKMDCKGCVSIGKPFWGDACPVKSCCEERKLGHCGLCPDFPCDLLTQFAFDKEQGDNGKRIEQCKVWASVQ